MGIVSYFSFFPVSEIENVLGWFYPLMLCMSYWALLYKTEVRMSFGHYSPQTGLCSTEQSIAKTLHWCNGDPCNYEMPLKMPAFLDHWKCQVFALNSTIEDQLIAFLCVAKIKRRL